jgi:FAD/FMN-containing dehydrogenase
MASVRFAREWGLVLSMRSGGHGVAGLAICDDGLVIDLSAMKTMRTDPRRRVARCDPGLTLVGAGTTLRRMLQV